MRCLLAKGTTITNCIHFIGMVQLECVQENSLGAVGIVQLVSCIFGRRRTILYAAKLIF